MLKGSWGKGPKTTSSHVLEISLFLTDGVFFFSTFNLSRWYITD